MIVAVVTTWAVTIGQLVMLDSRLKDTVPAGPKRYKVKTWFATSLPIFVAEGFYLLLTYTKSHNPRPVCGAAAGL
ncbi:MAG TPA: hypothetical protein VLN61_06825 [Pseudolabrys sp.]|nr:hypothetical protein [Pseudolabrys sp.]